jgi:hypothetical protein
MGEPPYAELHPMKVRGAFAERQMTEGCRFCS